MLGKLNTKNFRRDLIKYIGVAALVLVMAALVAKPLIVGASEFLLERYSGIIIEECRDAPYKPLCYENEVMRVARFLKMEDSFRLTKKVQEKDPGFAYCHVLAHKISFLEAKRNVSDWKDVMGRCPVAMCNYGCLHGALIEHFRGEVLDDFQIEEAIGDLINVCEPREGFNPTEIDRTMCYHALGHLGMYITGGNPGKSTEICSRVSLKPDGRDYYETCVEGVFMTVFQGVDPEDIALVKDIKPNKNEVKKFCSNYTGVEYEACNRESYPLFRDELKNPSYFSKFCGYSLTLGGEWKCWATVIGDATVEILEGLRTDSIEKLCTQLPKEMHSQCFANVAARMIQVEPDNLEKALAVCKTAESYSVSAECYRDVIGYASFTVKPGTPEFENYCNKLPEEWSRECLETGQP
jgi:hypothetical protein